MSRLDDELRAAFRRVEPSADFAERVLRRINYPTPAKPTFWQKLKSFLEPPVTRWVALGVATSLLVAIFAAEYQRLQSVTPEQQAPPIIGESSPGVKLEDRAPQPAPAPLYEKEQRQVVKHQPIKRKAAADRNHLAQQRKDRRLRVEAERAKEQLLLALQIASTTLNEANRMVRDDD